MMEYVSEGLFLYFCRLKSKITVYNLYENVDETYEKPIIFKECIILQIFFDTICNFNKNTFKIVVTMYIFYDLL